MLSRIALVNVVLVGLCPNAYLERPRWQDGWNPYRGNQKMNILHDASIWYWVCGLRCHVSRCSLRKHERKSSPTTTEGQLTLLLIQAFLQ